MNASIVKRAAICGLCSFLCVLGTRVVATADRPPIDALFQKFWDARNPDDAAKAARQIVAASVPIDDALARLRRGRTYSAQVKRGVVKLQRRNVAGDFPYTVDVPEGYDPARKYQVRVQLHGGVAAREAGQVRGTGAIGALAGAEQIYVLPTGWRDAPWWSRAQLENIDAILDALKRSYNVDENRIVAAGVSDGATGLYYLAMRDTTPFASFLPLNGSMMVLANDRLGVDANLFPTNLLNKPLFIVNGGQDPLYPMKAVEPYIKHLDDSGVSIAYHPRPEAAHNTVWWPEMKDTFEAFVRDHPRVPLPERLTWEAADRDLPARAHWIEIDRVAANAAGTPLEPDLNVFSGAGFNHGRELYGRTRPSGRVDAVRRGNTVDLKTRGVSELTLLVSPDAFDLSQPIVVTANGRTVSNGRVESSLATLMKWAARDNDRTMLFTAELRITPR